MRVVLVAVHVRSGCEAAFIEKTSINAAASRKEAGVARFDVLQDPTDPGRFLLIEVYRNEQAPLAHKETPHYQQWRDAVEPLMAEPRSSTKWHGIDPNQAAW